MARTPPLPPDSHAYIRAMAQTPVSTVGLTHLQRALAGAKGEALKFAVGSKNATKVNATRQALSRYMSDESTYEVFGCSVPSNVSDQPKSAEECMEGAINRARGALEKEGADFGVGIEGGVEQIRERWFDSGWVAVIDKAGNIGIGTSARMEIGAPVIKRILAGEELGDVADDLSQRTNVRTTGGYFGLCTQEQLPRTEAYVHGVVFAMAPFVSHAKFWECASDS